MKKFSLLSGVSIIFLVSLAFAGEETNLAEVNCVSSSDKRKLVMVKEDEGCRVDYTKGGTTQKLGNQKSGQDFCEKLIDRVKVKLSQSGFDCK